MIELVAELGQSIRLGLLGDSILNLFETCLSLRNCFIR